MKKNLLTLALCAGAFGLGLGLNSIAVSDVEKAQKIGYVSTAKILQSSKTFKAAQEERAKSTNEMLKWYQTAKADIQKQTTQEAKKAAMQKYEAQLTQKKKTINETYSKKMQSVEKQVTDSIAQKAQALGYDIVLKDSVVLYGGSDITTQVLPLIK